MRFIKNNNIGHAWVAGSGAGFKVTLSKHITQSQVHFTNSAEYDESVKYFFFLSGNYLKYGAVVWRALVAIFLETDCLNEMKNKVLQKEHKGETTKIHQIKREIKTCAIVPFK